MEDPVFLRPPTPSEESPRDRVLRVAMKCFADKGFGATSLRSVAAESEVSVGLVQHHFGNKAGLIAEVDAYVLRTFGEILESSPLPETPTDHVAVVRGRFAELVIEHPDVMNYVAHALVEGEDLGAVIFDGLLQISTTQGQKFSELGMVRDDLDNVWGPLNPLILRVGAIILRNHIERHLPGPFYAPEQVKRWDSAVTALIRQGQLIEPAAQG